MKLSDINQYFNSLAAGDYFIHVYSAGNNFDLNQCYSLRIDTKQPTADLQEIADDKEKQEQQNAVTLFPILSIKHYLLKD